MLKKYYIRDIHRPTMAPIFFCFVKHGVIFALFQLKGLRITKF